MNMVDTKININKTEKEQVVNKNKCKLFWNIQIEDIYVYLDATSQLYNNKNSIHSLLVKCKIYLSFTH